MEIKSFFRDIYHHKKIKFRGKNKNESKIEFFGLMLYSLLVC